MIPRRRCSSVSRWHGWRQRPRASMSASVETGLADATPHPLPIDDGRRRHGGEVRPTAAVGGLIWTLIRTDFKARYHGTLSGFIWALLKPTAMFLVLVAVFSFVFGAEPNYKL